MSAPNEAPSPSSRRRNLGLLGVAALVVGLVGLGMINAANPGDVGPARPSPTRLVATPTPASAVSYDAVFDGDPTGETDVTAALKAFLESHNGQRVALVAGGTYSVTQLSFTAQDLTVDFRGARIRATQEGAYGIFKVQASSRIVLNNPFVIGTGYEWTGGESNPSQWEHGIEIDGGSDITINHPTTRDTRGDGIYIGFESGKTRPPTGIVINNPDIERSARNGIAPVAGEVSIIGGHIYDSGLHAVDFEPNNDEGGSSIVGIVDGVDIRRFQNLDVAGLTGYAVAGFGFTTAIKPSILVQNVTGDVLRILIPDTAKVTIRNNISDTDAIADFPNTGAVIFTNNVRIKRR